MPTSLIEERIRNFTPEKGGNKERNGRGYEAQHASNEPKIHRFAMQMRDQLEA